MATSTRSTRSRYSSPHPLANGPLEPSKSSANEGSKTLMQKWLEPTVQSRPSYEDHGLLRYGVTEGMAALGELPKSAVVAATKKKGGAEGTPVRKIILKQSSAQAQAGSADNANHANDVNGRRDINSNGIALSTSLQNSFTNTPPSFPSRRTAPAAKSALSTPTLPPLHPSPPSHYHRRNSPPALSSFYSPPSILSPSTNHFASTEKASSRRALPSSRDSEDEYDPKGSVSKISPSSRPSLPRRSLPRASTGRRSSFSQNHTMPRAKKHPASAPTPETPLAGSPEAPATAPTTASAADAANASSSSSAAGGTAATGHAPPDKASLEKSVEIAVENGINEALRFHHYPTAYALRTLHDENASDHEFLVMMDAMFRQTADEATVLKYCKLVEAKRKEGAKNHRAYLFFVPSAAKDKPINPPEPIPAPYGHLITLKMPTLKQRSKKRKQLHEEQEPSEPQEPPQQKRASQPSQQLRTPATKGRRKGRKTPGTGMDTKSGRRTGNSAAGDDVAAVLDDYKTSPRKRARRGSMASDSSALTELSSSPPPPTPTPASKRGATRGQSGAAVAESATRADGTESALNQLRPSRRTATLGAARQAAAARGLEHPLPMASANGHHHPAPPNDEGDAEQQHHSNTRSKSKSQTKSSSSKTKPTRIINLKVSRLPQSRVAEEQQEEKEDINEEPAQGSAIVDAPQPASDDYTPQTESFVRGPPRVEAPTTSTQVLPSAPLEAAERQTRTPPPVVAPTRGRKTRNAAQAAPAISSRRTTRSGKRTFDELDDGSTPAPSLPGNLASALNSRAGTPASTRPAKKQRTTGLRVKSSPVKKKTGTAAGVPRPSGEGLPNGGPSNPDDNDDYCSACGGVGDLVCCETCTRSFHFECVDMGLGETLPDEWFCYSCGGNRLSPSNGPPRRIPGIFGPLSDALDKTNPQAFSLPNKIQTLFEGVAVGPEGEYEEITAPKPTKRRGGYEEVPDFHRTRDNEGNVVLCHGCAKAAAHNRPIIPCSGCSFYWHLDCLDPPLAIPPVLRNWKCPCHADDLLAQLPHGSLWPAHKFRLIKGAPPIEIAASRGMRNNGYIELIDSTDEEDGDDDFENVTSFGRTYKLPKEGIKLDFISQMRKKKKNPVTKPITTEQAMAAKAAAAAIPVDERPPEQVQAAVALAGLQVPQKEGIPELIDALIANAEPSLLTALAGGNAANLASGMNLDARDKQSLRALLAQSETLTAYIKDMLASKEHQSDKGDMTPKDNQDGSGAIQKGNETSPKPANDGEEESVHDAADDSAENDLPTPATTAHENADPPNGTVEETPAEQDANELIE